MGALIQFFSHCLIHVIMLGLHVAAIIFTLGLGLFITIPLHLMIWLLAASSAKR